MKKLRKNKTKLEFVVGGCAGIVIGSYYVRNQVIKRKKMEIPDPLYKYISDALDIADKCRILSVNDETKEYINENIIKPYKGKWNGIDIDMLEKALGLDPDEELFSLVGMTLKR